MKRYVVAAGGAVALLVPAVAGAQPPAEKSYVQQGIPAPARALELAVGTGYTQGFGELVSGVAMSDVAKGGVGIEGSIGFRIEPRWGVSMGGQYQELTPENADSTRGVSFTIAAQYHVDPMKRLDPWLELGGGWRVLWQNGPLGAGEELVSYGFELGRARVGFDIRVSPDVAIAPLIGADASMFVWRTGGLSEGAIRDPSINTFIFVGLQGRVDVGGTRVGTTTLTSAEPR